MSHAAWPMYRSQVCHVQNPSYYFDLEVRWKKIILGVQLLWPQALKWSNLTSQLPRAVLSSSRKSCSGVLTSREDSEDLVRRELRVEF